MAKSASMVVACGKRQGMRSLVVPSPHSATPTQWPDTVAMASVPEELAGGAAKESLDCRFGVSDVDSVEEDAWGLANWGDSQTTVSYDFTLAS